VDAFSRGEADIVSGLSALGGEDVRVQWLRSRRPHAVMVEGRFDSLTGVLDRLLAPCGIPYESRLTESEGLATWTLGADAGPGGERVTEPDDDGCVEGIDGLVDAFEELRIILESGTFTAATGFTIEGTIAAILDEAALEESVKTTGRIDLLLSWKAL